MFALKGARSFTVQFESYTLAMNALTVFVRSRSASRLSRENMDVFQTEDCSAGAQKVWGKAVTVHPEAEAGSIIRSPTGYRISLTKAKIGLFMSFESQDLTTNRSSISTRQ